MAQVAKSGAFKKLPKILLHFGLVFPKIIAKVIKKSPNLVTLLMIFIYLYSPCYAGRGSKVVANKKSKIFCCGLAAISKALKCQFLYPAAA